MPIEFNDLDVVSKVAGLSSANRPTEKKGDIKNKANFTLPCR